MGVLLQLQLIDDILERFPSHLCGFEQKCLLSRLEELFLERARLLGVGRSMFLAFEPRAVRVLELLPERVVGVSVDGVLVLGFGFGFEAVWGVPVFLVHVFPVGGDAMAVRGVGGRVRGEKDVRVGGVAEKFERLRRDAGLHFHDG